MNKKGQALNGILLTFIGIVVGVILFTAVSQEVGNSTNTVAVANTTLATTVNGTAQYITGYKAISSVVVYNATGGTIASGNYTIENNVVYNGALAIKITPTVNSAIYLSAWKVSGTAEPTGYISDSAARNVAGLIAIFFALAIAVVALTPTFQGKLLEAFGK